METRTFGNSPLKVSKIGLGLAALGRPGYINLGHGSDLDFNYQEGAMQQRAMEVMETAYEQGIRYFDAARSYGKAEAFLSRWINNHPERKDFTVGSKWGYTYTADWKVSAEKHEVKEHSLERLNHQWPLSQQLLGERLKIYQIHSATPESGVLDNEEVLNRLWELRESGIIVGLSLSGVSQAETLKKAFTIKRREAFLFQSVQLSYNLLEQSVAGLLEKASQLGFGIIVKEALANGRLTAKNEDPVFREKKLLLEELSLKYGVGIDALSLAFVLDSPWVSTVLSGASTKEQLLSNLKAQSVRLSKEDMQRLNGLKEAPEAYWQKRSLLKWN